MAKPAKTRSRKAQKVKPSPRRNLNSLWIGLSIGLLALVALGVFLLGQGINNDAIAQALPAEINVQAAAEMRADGAFILDVREPDEWVEYHIPGATLIPLGELESRLNEVPRDQEVVVVCRSGNRSQAGRDILRQNGYTQSTSMGGGMLGWQAAGYEITSGQ